jgi:hypothetical protein
MMPYLTNPTTGIYPLAEGTYAQNMSQGYLGQTAEQQGINAQTQGQLGQWNDQWQNGATAGQNFSQDYGTQINPVANIGQQNVSSPGSIGNFSVDANAARQGMGSLDPTGALQKSLSGQIDTQGLDAMQQSATNRAMIGYGDAVADAGTMYNQQIAPQIRSNAILDGGYGGSRQGIAEGVAAGELNEQLARNARDLGTASMDVGSNLYGNAYQTAQANQYGAASNLNNQAVDTSTGNANRAYGADTTNVSNQMNTGQFNANMGYGTDQFNANLQANNNTQLGQVNQQNANIATQGQNMFDSNTNSYLASQAAQSGLAGMGQQDARSQQAFDWEQLNNYISAIQGDRGMTTTGTATQSPSMLSNISTGAAIGNGISNYLQPSGSTVTPSTYAADTANNPWEQY